MQLYITRHGQSCGNARTQEGPDPELTELGFLQARLLGERLSALRLDCIISSPLIRALATANEIAKAQPGGPASVELLPDIVEKGLLPGYAGLPFEELKVICPTIIPYGVPTAAGGGAVLEYEDSLRAYARALRVIGYIRSRFCGDENVLLVAHGAFNSRLIAAALGLPLPDHFRYSQDHTGLTLIKYFTEYGHENTRLSFSNDNAHLCMHGLSERI